MSACVYTNYIPQLSAEEEGIHSCVYQRWGNEQKGQWWKITKWCSTWAVKKLRFTSENMLGTTYGRWIRIALLNIYKWKSYEEIKSWGRVFKTKTKYLAKGSFHARTGIYHIHMAYVYKQTHTYILHICWGNRNVQGNLSTKTYGLLRCTEDRDSYDLEQENKTPKTMQVHITWRCTSLIFITYLICRCIYMYICMYVYLLHHVHCAYSFMTFFIIITLSLIGLLKLT